MNQSFGSHVVNVLHRYERIKLLGLWQAQSHRLKVNLGADIFFKECLQSVSAAFCNHQNYFEMPNGLRDAL